MTESSARGNTRMRSPSLSSRSMRWTSLGHGPLGHKGPRSIYTATTRAAEGTLPVPRVPRCYCSLSKQCPPHRPQGLYIQALSGWRDTNEMNHEVHIKPVIRSRAEGRDEEWHSAQARARPTGTAAGVWLDYVMIGSMSRPCRFWQLCLRNSVRLVGRLFSGNTSVETP